MKKVVQNLHVFPFFMGFVNVYLLETPDGLLLVDTGVSAAQMQRVTDDIQAAGHDLSELKHIFITHAHPDHTGGLRDLQKRLPATTQTYAHAHEARVIRGEAPILKARPEDVGMVSRLMLRFMPDDLPETARVDVEVSDGDTIADMVQVVALPGHSPGHCGLWWEQARILIGGDVVMHAPWGLVKPLAPATPDMPTAKQSIQKVAQMQPEMVCICHGAPIKAAASVMRDYAARVAG
ncbi:MAG: MBL fold metallo-hydrolase [Armatimonadetes bacterium]|nr:MBL fold metallo-hydrolase [Anaerolineae bacterium]